MFDRALRRFRDAIMSGEYTITPHGQEELRSDDLTLFDVECCVLTGCIVDRQWDSRRNEWKYLIEGRSVAGTTCVLVVKWSRAGRLSVLTAFALEG